MTLHGKDDLHADSAQRYLAPLRDHEFTALRLFPELRRATMKSRSLSSAGALFLGYFLGLFPQETVVLETGSSIGDSTLWFAEHPKVSRVVSINLNFRMTSSHSHEEEALPGTEVSGQHELGTLDVARAVVEEYPRGRERVRFYEGSSEMLPDILKETKSPEAEEELVVFVDGRLTREGVAETLKTVFDEDSRATVILNGCRHERGPFVQAGAVDFVQQSEEKYRFRLVGDLGPALAGSELGVVYFDEDADRIGSALQGASREFSHKLDPLRLLGREEELMNAVSRVNRQLTRANEHRARLERRIARLNETSPALEAQLEKQRAQNAALLAHYSSRRYKLVDALAGALKKLPVLAGLLRRYPPSTGGD